MITQELVKEFFTHVDGKLYWKKVSHASKASLIGKEAGSIHPTGYRYVTWLNKSHKVHRLIFLLEHGYLPSEIDHINNDRLDNRLENLRPASRSENQCNRFLLSSNSSGYQGVNWHKHAKSWYVRVMKNGKSHIIGYYKDLELAGLVSQEARILYHGKFAKQF
jgi:hypothetical protein